MVSINKLPRNSNAGILWIIVQESLQGISNSALCPLLSVGQREDTAIQEGLEGKPELMEIAQKSSCTCYTESTQEECH